MLSRIMRHPAGLMKKALGGRFLPASWAHKDASAEPPPYPVYWSHRYSGLGLLLGAPAAAAPAAPVVPATVRHRGKAFLLPAQEGKASSFLYDPSDPSDPSARKAPEVPAARR